jgi:hypothetical protein
MIVDAKRHPEYLLLRTVLFVSILVIISVALDSRVIRQIRGLSKDYCSRGKHLLALYGYIQSQDTTAKSCKHCNFRPLYLSKTD